MGLIFDLAIVALALVVVGSLALLAWTLAVSAVDAVRRETASVTEARVSVAAAEGRIRRAAANASNLDALASRAGTQRPDGGEPSHRREQPNA